MALTETPRINSTDPFAAARADIDQRYAAFAEAADIWAERSELDEELAERANDFLAGAKRLLADAERARKAEKQPHLDAGRAVDQSWDAIKTRIEKLVAVVAPKLAAYLRKKQEFERAEAEAARQRAAEAEAAANAAKLDAANAASASARIEAEERAAAQARIAETAKADAEDLSGPTRVESATGLANRRGLRTVRKARITSLPQALAYFATHNRAEIEELLLQLANAQARHAPTVAGQKRVPKIPGVEFVETQEL